MLTITLFIIIKNYNKYFKSRQIIFVFQNDIVDKSISEEIEAQDTRWCAVSHKIFHPCEIKNQNSAFVIVKILWDSNIYN